MPLLQWIQANMTAPWLDVLMVAITKSGDMAAVWFVLALLLCLKPQTRPYACRIVTAVVLSVLVCNLGLKPLFCRLRPFEVAEHALLIAPPHGSSFPSGHSCASFAAALSLCRAEKRLFLPACAYAALIAFSRMYLFVHFPGDVLAGALIGAALGLAADRIWQRLATRKAAPRR